jgi:hypothetical protein
VSDFSARSPKTWAFLGSNDGSTWTTLDTEASQTSWGTPETRNFGFSASANYRYFKINITANNGDGTYTGFAEMQLYYATASGICVLDSGHVASHIYNNPVVLNTAGTTLLAATITVKGSVSGSLSNPTSTPSTTWHCLTKYADAGNNVAVEICYAPAPTASPSQSITCNNHGSFCEFYSFKGTLATTGVYQMASDHGARCTSCLSLAAGSVTPMTANALVVSVWGDDGTDISTISVPALIYTDVTTANNTYFPNAGIGYKLNAPISAINPTWTETVSGTSPNMAVAEAVFCSTAPCGVVVRHPGGIW